MIEVIVILCYVDQSSKDSRQMGQNDLCLASHFDEKDRRGSCPVFILDENLQHKVVRVTICDISCRAFDNNNNNIIGLLVILPLLSLH